MIVEGGGDDKAGGRDEEGLVRGARRGYHLALL